MPGTPENRNIPVQTPVPEQNFTARRVAWAASLGVTALLAINAQSLDTSHPNPSFGTGIADAHVGRPHPRPAQTAEKPEKASRHCTSIRTRAMYLYLGWACTERGDSYMPIEMDENKGSEWTYGAIRLSVKGNDIVKCGVVRKGVLPIKPARPRAVSHCKDYYSDLVEKGNVYVEDHNCTPIVNGYDPCTDGTPPRRVSSTCTNPQTYRNFESDKPSPLNVYGTGKGGFRQVITENKKTSMRYRVKFTMPTRGGTEGIVVRAPKWGWGNDKCVPEDHRDGGPLKEK